MYQLYRLYLTIQLASREMCFPGCADMPVIKSAVMKGRKTTECWQEGTWDTTSRSKWTGISTTGIWLSFSTAPTEWTTHVAAYIQGGPKMWHNLFVRLNFINYKPIKEIISPSNQKKFCNNTITKNPINLKCDAILPCEMSCFKRNLKTRLPL